MSTTTATKRAAANVGMGQALMARAGETLGSILGSCVGLVIYHPRLKVGAMAHIVLPDSAGRTGTPGKYADVAIPHLIKMLQEAGVAKSGLVAKLAGGSRMFGNKGPTHIGDSNVEAVLRNLEQLNVHVTGKHVGGNKGRRVTWDPVTGDFAIQVIGESLEVI